MMPAVKGAKFAKVIHGMEPALEAFEHAHRVLGEPSYSFLAYAASAAERQYRSATAQALAALVDRNMLDTGMFAAQLGWMLQGEYVMAGRVIETLQDAASISPLAGWRVCQVLQGLLPVVKELNRGGALVQLLAQLAGEYGVSVEIPEVLRPKMKGSTVLAKNLRALSALGPHSTELAHQAQEQANNTNPA